MSAHETLANDPLSERQEDSGMLSIDNISQTNDSDPTPPEGNKSFDDIRDAFYALEREEQAISDLETLSTAGFQVLVDEYGAQAFADAIYTSENLYGLLSKLEPHQEVRYVLYEQLKGAFQGDLVEEQEEIRYQLEEDGFEDGLHKDSDDLDTPYYSSRAGRIIGEIRYGGIEKDELVNELEQNENSLQAVVNTRKAEYDRVAEQVISAYEGLTNRPG